MIHSHSTHYLQQLQHKKHLVATLLAPFYQTEIEVFDSPEQHFRQRAEFRIWHQGQHAHYAMFNPNNKREPYFIKDFPIASQLINHLMPLLEKAWQEIPILRHKLFQTEFHTTLAGDKMITLCYHCPIEQEWLEIAQSLAKELKTHLIGRSRKKRQIIGQSYVNEILNIDGLNYHYQQPEGSFSQPNAEVCQKMLNWVYQHCPKDSRDLLELYCGNGNFTLPLSKKFTKVLATEVSKTAVNAAQTNILNNHINNIQIARLSAEELTQALKQEHQFNRLSHINLGHYHFSTVFVDPPRAGLNPETCALLQQFDQIIYISCNPVTLAQNLAHLTQTHRISDCAIFDQFPWTSHIETGVFLQKS